MDSEIGLNQDLAIDCDATGRPQPQVVWIKHPTVDSNGINGERKYTPNFVPHRNYRLTFPIEPDTKPVTVVQGKLLKITRAQHRDSGLYECVARNGADQDLRRLIQVKVRGKLMT